MLFKDETNEQTNLQKCESEILIQVNEIESSGHTEVENTRRNGSDCCKTTSPSSDAKTENEHEISKHFYSTLKKHFFIQRNMVCVLILKDMCL